MKSLAAWFIRNGVAPNLLMVLIIVGGAITITGIRQEVFPTFSSGTINVSVLYPGALPEDIEEGICLKIEEAISDLSGIDEIKSTAVNGSGVVNVKLIRGTNEQEMLNLIESRVNAIDTFPEDAEEPLIEIVRRLYSVIKLSVYGNTDIFTLRKLAEEVKDDLLLLDEISHVSINNVPKKEISIEIDEQILDKYNLTFSKVLNTIRQWSLRTPGGAIDSSGGKVILRTDHKAYTPEEFSDIPIITTEQGAAVRLGDIALVRDSFEETDQQTTMDGKPAIIISVFREGDQNALRLASSVKMYAERKQLTLPGGIRLTTWNDMSRILSGRMNLLIKNGLIGLALVLIILSVFLKLRLAFWVAAGLPVSFLGALWLFPFFGLSINLISLFAFIVILGILVDDAIVISENVYTHAELGKNSLDAAISGINEIMLPVILTIMTTIAAFLPILIVPGDMGKWISAMPIIVTSCLAFSLIEGIFILPTHLSHVNFKNSRENIWSKFQSRFAKRLGWFVSQVYTPSLAFAIKHRYVSVSLAISFLIVIFGLVGGGIIQFNYFPPIDADNVVATVELPKDSTSEMTREVVESLHSNAEQLMSGLNDGSVYRHIIASVGSQPYMFQATHGTGVTEEAFKGTHLGEVNIELAPSEERTASSSLLEKEWRKSFGEVPGSTQIKFYSTLISTGAPIDILLTSSNMNELNMAADALKKILRQYEGVYEISDSITEGPDEMNLRVSRKAIHSSINPLDLSESLKSGYYGAEVQKIQRGRDEIKVVLKYPKSHRTNLGELDTTDIRSIGSEDKMVFASAAIPERKRSLFLIERKDGHRSINITAQVDRALNNPNTIIKQLKEKSLPKLVSEFSSINYEFEGEQKEQTESMDALLKGLLITVIVIFALIAVPYKSYLIPFVILTAVPFGIAGAIIAHFLLGFDLSIMSFFGILALTGVVINDSLIMVDFITRYKDENKSIMETILMAGPRRFRPVIITSLTTFAGLIPLIMERSIQAQFLIPTAISLAFGVLFATAITLIIIPCVYMINEDMRSVIAGKQSE